VAKDGVLAGLHGTVQELRGQVERLRAERAMQAGEVDRLTVVLGGADSQLTACRELLDRTRHELGQVRDEAVEVRRALAARDEELGRLRAALSGAGPEESAIDLMRPDYALHARRREGLWDLLFAPNGDLLVLLGAWGPGEEVQGLRARERLRSRLLAGLGAEQALAGLPATLLALRYRPGSGAASWAGPGPPVRLGPGGQVETLEPGRPALLRPGETLLAHAGTDAAGALRRTLDADAARDPVRLADRLADTGVAALVLLHRPGGGEQREPAGLRGG
jgi:hypothetical protein